MTRDNLLTLTTGVVTPDELNDPIRRMEIANEFYSSGLFPAIARAQEYLEALAAFYRGDDVSQELAEFVREGTELAKRVRELNAKRDEALARQSELACKRSACDRIEKTLAGERELLRSLASEIENVGTYSAGAHAGSQLNVRISSFIFGHHATLFAEHLRTVIIPALERDLEAAKKDLESFWGHAETNSIQSQSLT